MKTYIQINLVCIFLFYLTLSCFAENGSKTIINMSLVPIKDNSLGGFARLKCNEDGIAELPFSNSQGKLRFKLKDKIVYFDSNGDGAFTGKDAQPIRPGESFNAPITINGTQYQYHIRVEMTLGSIFLLSLHSCLKSEYNGNTIYLYDSNMNGDFSEIAIDQLQINDDFSNKIFVGKTIALGNTLYMATFKARGAKIILSPYKGAVSRLKLLAPKGLTISLFLSNGKEKIFNIAKSGGTALLIPGTYTIEYAESSQTATANTPSYYLLGATGLEKQNSIVLKKGIQFLLGGPPYTLKFEAEVSREDNDLITIKSPRLESAIGAQYAAEIRSKQLKSLLTCSIRSGDKEQQLSKMEFG